MVTNDWNQSFINITFSYYLIIIWLLCVNTIIKSYIEFISEQFLKWHATKSLGF